MAKDCSDDELFDGEAHILNYAFKFINTMSLKCAIELRIPDIIHSHGKPMTLPHLAHALSINHAKSTHLRRLMRLLVHSGFFTGDDEGYRLAPASRLLLEHGPFCAAPFCRVVVDRLMQDPWHHLSAWLSGGGGHLTAFEAAHGAAFWDYTERVPRLNRLFNEAMASDSSLVNHVVLADCGTREAFRGFETLVDVGGGTGAMAGAIAGAFPEMACVVLDLPHVVAGLRGNGNLTYVEGDMFDAIPHADLILLKSILHDWNDEDSVKILKKCREAIGSSSKERGGKVMIIDMVLNNHGGGEMATEDQLLYDTAMMTYLNGKERDEKEWASMFADAGFSGYKITLSIGVRSLIEVYP